MLERLTTDNPKSNLENALNRFFVKNGETWVRGYGRGPEHGDITLNDLAREMAKTNNVMALFYTAALVWAELRARLMAYEDTGMTPEGITAAANRWHDCKIDCLLEAHNKLLDEIEQLGGMEEIRRGIQERPKHGTWNGEGDGYADGKIVHDVWECSECGYIIDDGTDDPKRLPNYCPNCGVSMKEV